MTMHANAIVIWGGACGPGALRSLDTQGSGPSWCSCSIEQPEAFRAVLDFLQRAVSRLV